MILVADSGSTKTDWGIIGSNGEKEFTTLGMNPYFYGTSKIIEILNTELPSSLQREQVKEIYFYGAGCSSKLRKSRVAKALEVVFPNALLMVDHDLLGAARALCGKEKGIATIMGTGSNACLFDGEKIIDQHGGIGFILGDEASGAYLGRQLIQRLFYKELPEEIELAFYQKYGTNKNEIIKGIYEKPNPNRYLASYALFYRDFEENEYMIDIISQSFKEFIVRHILRFKDFQEYPFHALGSIAYHFQHILNPVLEEHHIKKGKIVRKPIEQLVQFHS